MQLGDVGWNTKILQRNSCEHCFMKITCFPKRTRNTSSINTFILKCFLVDTCRSVLTLSPSVAVCGKLEPPEHGFVNCSDDESINCTVACDAGYEFSIEPLPYYYCGPDTASRWSHRTEDNPRARVPDCAGVLNALASKLFIYNVNIIGILIECVFEV